MSILIGADIVPTSSNRDLFCLGNAYELIGPELKEVLESADFRVFNLETPLVDIASPIKKQGGALMAPTEAARGLKAMNINLVTLANNHIMDQGEKGLYSTLQALNREDIAYVGAGQDIKAAVKPFVFQIEGKKYGIYSCAEHEFSIADAHTPGANPFDPLESLDHVSELCKQCDYVIVLYHGGKEYYKFPSPHLQKICHKLVDKGANLVVCQHSHCLGTFEKYGNGTIVYGQGNFLFDDGERECLLTGMLVQISQDDRINFVPVVKNGCSVRLANSDEKEKILNRLAADSKCVLDPAFIEAQYQTFANEYRNGYLKTMLGTTSKSLLFRVINRITGRRWEQYVLRKRYREKELLAMRNFIECEAHRELFLKGIGQNNEP